MANRRPGGLRSAGERSLGPKQQHLKHILDPVLAQVRARRLRADWVTKPAAVQMVTHNVSRALRRVMVYIITKVPPTKVPPPGAMAPAMGRYDGGVARGSARALWRTIRAQVLGKAGTLAVRILRVRYVVWPIRSPQHSVLSPPWAREHWGGRVARARW